MPHKRASAPSSPPPTFVEWCRFQQYQQKMTPQELRRWLEDEVRRLKVKASRPTVRNVMMGAVEPRLPLRRALMKISGLPMESFAKATDAGEPAADAASAA